MNAEFFTSKLFDLRVESDTIPSLAIFYSKHIDTLFFSFSEISKVTYPLMSVKFDNMSADLSSSNLSDSFPMLTRLGSIIIFLTNLDLPSSAENLASRPLRVISKDQHKNSKQFKRKYNISILRKTWQDIWLHIFTYTSSILDFISKIPVTKQLSFHLQLKSKTQSIVQTALLKSNIILKNMANAQFLLHSFLIFCDQGEKGPLSLLSIIAILDLINHYNIEYPDFFQKVYSLLTPKMFVSFNRTLFYKFITTLFLRSSYPHFPLTSMASFLKRMLQLALHSPPDAAATFLMIAQNMIISQPDLIPLVHYSSSALVSLRTSSNEESQITRKPVKITDRRLLYAIKAGLVKVDNFNPDDFSPNSNTIKQSLSNLKSGKKPEPKPSKIPLKSHQLEQLDALSLQKTSEDHIRKQAEFLTWLVILNSNSPDIKKIHNADPYNSFELNVTKTGAIKSSLWELRVLENSNTSAIAHLAKKFRKTSFTSHTNYQDVYTLKANISNEEFSYSNLLNASVEEGHKQVEKKFRNPIKKKPQRKSAKNTPAPTSKWVRLLDGTIVMTRQTETNSEKLVESSVLDPLNEEKRRKGVLEYYNQTELDSLF